MATESTIQNIRRFLDQENLWISEGKEDLDDLAYHLNLMNAFIKNCEGKRDQDDIARETIRRSTELAQQAKDLFKYVMGVVNDSQKRRNNSEEVSPGWNCISIPGGVAGMAQELTKNIKNNLDDFQRYGNSMNVVGHCVRPNARATFGSTTGEKSSKYTFKIASPVVRSVRDKEPSDLKFEIESYQALVDSAAGKIESSEFISGGHSWVMVVYLSGNMRDNETDHVSLCLRLVEKPTGRNSVNASFKFFILDKQDETYVTIHDGKERKFDAGQLEWGISQALPRAAFNDASNGLLVNDSCTFGAEVYVIKNTPTLVRLSLIQEQTLRSHLWAVECSSLLRNETYSSDFPIEGRSWKLFLYPKGHLRGKGKYLSLYLYLVGATDLTGGKKLYVDFVLSIKDQLTGIDYERSVGFWFDSDKDHQGFDDFLPLTELNNPHKAYKANGTVNIEATIKEMFLVTQVS